MTTTIPTMMPATDQMHEQQQQQQDQQQHVMVVPTKDDLEGLAILQAVADRRDSFREHQRVTPYFHCPVRLQNCRIIKSSSSSSNDNSSNKNKVLAACQLSWKKKDKQSTKQTKHNNFTDDIDAHDDKVVFVEWIACLPDHQGNKFGSTLLQWAAEYAKHTLKVNSLSLYCVKSNHRAVKLYRRRGFIEQKRPTTYSPNSSSSNRNSNHDQKKEHGQRRDQRSTSSCSSISTTATTRSRTVSSSSSSSSSSYRLWLTKIGKKIVSNMFLGLDRHWTILTMKKTL